MPREDARVYVGNLPPDIRTLDIEDLFSRCGKILKVDLKTRRGPPFAFIEFEEARDADYAISKRDGYNYDGYTLRVEFPRASYGGGGGGGGGGSYRDFGRPRGGGRRSHYGAPSRRSDYRVTVSGLPPSGSWQDLKDHMREAGDVCYADVYKDGSGVVEYLRYDDMKYALRKLDDTKFKSHEGEVSYIRVKEDRNSRSRSRSPKRGSNRRTPSYSPRTSRSPSRSSRSRSRSPY